MTEHPADTALLALAEGAAAPDPVREHVAACPTCRERVAACSAAERALTAAAPARRGWCPPRAELFDREALPPERATVVARHVAACPACRDDLRDLQALAAEPAATPAAAGPLRGRLALALDLAGRALEVIDSALPSFPEPAVAAARGDEAAEPEAAGPGLVVRAPFGEGALELRWAVARGGVDLQTRAVGGASRTYRLAVGPLPGPGEEAATWEGRTADAAGAVSFSGLEPGRYLLRAYAPLQGAPDLEVELDLAAEVG